MRRIRSRRHFLKRSLAFPFGAAIGTAPFVETGSGHAYLPKPPASHLKLSCNLYSFNDPLMSGAMTLDDVLKFCSDLGFAAVDPTGYYFPGYPAPPDDAYVYHIKQKAFLLGLDISGTGVRNDFTRPDADARAADVELVKRWVEVAAKMDAPVLRVFAGAGVPDGYTEAVVFDWLVAHLQACAAYGERHGVMIVLQNHNAVLKTVDQVMAILDRVDSDWFGLNLDIGSLRTTDDPYREIARLAPYACTWQIKESVYRNEQEEKTDLAKVVEILHTSGYRGYIPIETLGAGDPREKVPRFLDEVRQALG